jgi:serine/threonine-protein kinase RsbW
VNAEREASQVFELAILPAPDSVSVCRLFVGAVARHYAIDEDAVGDLKVAVSEAVTNSIKAHEDAGRDHIAVRVRIVCDEQSCRVEVRDEGFQPPAPVSEGAITPPFGLYEGSLGLLLIRALFPEAEIATGEEGRTTVRFAVKR